MSSPGGRGGSGSGPNPVPPALREFQRLWNQGAFWESHEVLEGPWRRGRSEFYHGLILLASGYVHVHRGNPHGILAQLEKGVRALQPFRPDYLGLDLETLLERVERSRRFVAERKEGPPTERWSDLVRAPALELDPSLVRGDEPELELQRPENAQKRRNRM